MHFVIMFDHRPSNIALAIREIALGKSRSKSRGESGRSRADANKHDSPRRCAENGVPILKDHSPEDSRDESGPSSQTGFPAFPHTDSVPLVGQLSDFSVADRSKGSKDLNLDRIGDGADGPVEKLKLS